MVGSTQYPGGEICIGLTCQEIWGTAIVLEGMYRKNGGRQKQSWRRWCPCPAVGAVECSARRCSNAEVVGAEVEWCAARNNFIFACRARARARARAWARTRSLRRRLGARLPNKSPEWRTVLWRNDEQLISHLITISFIRAPPLGCSPVLSPTSSLVPPRSTTIAASTVHSSRGR